MTAGVRGMLTALVVGVAGLLAIAVPARAQFPTRPGARQQVQPVRRDTTKKDSTALKRLPPADSVTQRLMQIPGYSVTRYAGDTAFFNAEQKSLDLLAAGKRSAVIDRDSTVVVSDTGVFYTQTNRHVVTGGNYIIAPPPSSGQAEIHSTSRGRVDYDLGERSFRINNASLPVNNGDMWYLTVKTARVDVDTSAAKQSVISIRGGTMTSCDDSIPDYHFEYKEAKRTGTTLAAAPAILYIKDIPVLWLPFIFTDSRPGRHSGILAPQFGLGDIVRNSPSYRRNVEHVGYYWAPSEYYDFATWLDWRSSAGATTGDPGWLRFNTDWNYKWLERFMGGRIGASYTIQNDQSTNTAVSWTHQEDFGRNNHLNTNVNFVTNTTIQRQNTFNPYTALATIASQASYQSKIGPASLTIGATRKQYPGRQQIDESVPTISLSTSPISVGKFLSWTPGFNYSQSDVLKMDQPGIGQYQYALNTTTNLRDSTLATNRNSQTATMSFDSPLQIFGWTLGNTIHVNQQRNNFPQQFTIYDMNTGAPIDQRIYSATYRSDIDWTPTFTLPSLGHNRFNLTPSFSMANIDPGPLWVASERTNGKYVSQGKRFSYGLSASPTLYHLFGGFGPFAAIRHAITPTISWNGAPQADVSDEYLQALGRTRAGYTGGLRQNQVTFGLTQIFEAKIRPRGNDTTGDNHADKVKLLSINVSPLSYDFERAAHARSVGTTSRWAGISTDNFNYSLNSDLLPGFDFSSQYSLFQGSTLSDTAQFKPYLTGISATFNVSRRENPFTVLSRIFGRAVPETRATGQPGTDQVRPTNDDAYAQALAAQPVAGSSRGGDRFIVPPTQGWKASFSFSRSSPRPPTGPNVINYDPRARCIAQVGSSDPFLLNTCLANERAAPTNEVPVTSLTAGAQQYNIPPTTSLNSNISFNLTPKWSANWTTTYDVEHHEFASHIVQLQRDLHDWRAMFGFTQSPNGNFAFNFTIALKPDPDIKFDYNRATVRNGIAGF